MGNRLEWLKNFDVFPKTVDDAKEVSVSGGSVRLLRARAHAKTQQLTFSIIELMVHVCNWLSALVTL